jgi:hypothetical protein
MENFFILKFKGFSDIFVHLSEPVLASLERLNETKKASEKLEKTFFEKLKKGESLITESCEYCHSESNLLSPCLHCLGDQEINNFLKLLVEIESFGGFFKKELKFFVEFFEHEQDEQSFPQMI